MGFEPSCTCVRELRENNRGGKDEVLMAVPRFVYCPVSHDIEIQFRINILNQST